MNTFKHKFGQTIGELSVIAVLASLVLLGSAMKARARVFVVSNTIQAAVDAANPGDRVRVPPGIYRENVLVTKDNISIEGSSGSVMDGTGLSGKSGITVKPPASSMRISGFRLSGLQIQNYSENGVILVRVDNFGIGHGKYLNNDEYGIFPISSSHGLIEFNQVSGSNDTGIYIGQSHDVVIKANYVSDCTVGIDVELSSNIAVQDNKAIENTIGMTTEVLPGLRVTTTTGVQIINNLLIGNNRPNPVTDPTELLSQLPTGAGLLIIGADGVTVKHNIVIQNRSVGIGIIQLPPAAAGLDPRVNPFPDNDEVLENVVILNGGDPDPKLAPFPPSDLIWDFSGSGNCWDDNLYKTSFPAALPDCP